jgi:hypothetical protein
MNKMMKADQVSNYQLLKNLCHGFILNWSMLGVCVASCENLVQNAQELLKKKEKC